MKMGLRTARKLTALMVTEFQPYGATWAELKKKSGMTRPSFKRALEGSTGAAAGQIYRLCEIQSLS